MLFTYYCYVYLFINLLNYIIFEASTLNTSCVAPCAWSSTIPTCNKWIILVIGQQRCEKKNEKQHSFFHNKQMFH